MVNSFSDTYAYEKGSQVITFVSFSMPDRSIKNIIDNSRKINAPVIIRGLIDNSLNKTISKIFNITKNNNDSFQIDPELFTEYRINKVPATLINIKEHKTVVYGDINVKDILTFVKNKHPSIETEIENILQKLN